MEEKKISEQKTQRPAVSICCLAYNHEKYIRDALDSFLAQKTSFPIEVLIHDDASTDGTADIIREYEKKYPDIMVTDKSGRRPYGARQIMDITHHAYRFY